MPDRKRLTTARAESTINSNIGFGNCVNITAEVGPWLQGVLSWDEDFRVAAIKLAESPR